MQEVDQVGGQKHRDQQLRCSPVPPKRRCPGMPQRDHTMPSTTRMFKTQTSTITTPATDGSSPKSATMTESQFSYQYLTRSAERQFVHSSSNSKTHDRYAAIRYLLTATRTHQRMLGVTTAASMSERLPNCLGDKQEGQAARQALPEDTKGRGKAHCLGAAVKLSCITLRCDSNFESASVAVTVLLSRY